MSTKSVESSGGQNLAQWLLNKKNWTTHFLIVTLISVAGLVYLGQQTYSGAPPLVDYVSADTGEVVRFPEADRARQGSFPPPRPDGLWLLLG